MGKEILVPGLNVNTIVNDPGLRQIYLKQVPDVYEDLWKRHGVDNDSITKNKRRLLETINDPNLSRKVAAKIISGVVFPNKLAIS